MTGVSLGKRDRKNGKKRRGAISGRGLAKGGVGSTHPSAVFIASKREGRDDRVLEIILSGVQRKNGELFFLPT